MTALPMGVGGSLQGESYRIPDGRAWVCLLAYGVLCQAVGWVVLSRGIGKVLASRVGLLLLLQPTLTFLWDVALLGRPTTVIELGGALLALGAIYLGSPSRETQEPRSLAGAAD